MDTVLGANRKKDTASFRWTVTSVKKKTTTQWLGREAQKSTLKQSHQQRHWKSENKMETGSTWSSVSIFCFLLPVLLVLRLWNRYLRPMSWSFSPLFPSRSLSISGLMFKSVIHFELALLCVWDKSPQTSAQLRTQSTEQQPTQQEENILDPVSDREL